MCLKYNTELKQKWGRNLYYGIHSNYIKFMYANESPKYKYEIVKTYCASVSLEILMKMALWLFS